jgi:hypothetical protein
MVSSDAVGSIDWLYVGGGRRRASGEVCTLLAPAAAALDAYLGSQAVHR